MKLLTLSYPALLRRGFSLVLKVTVLVSLALAACKARRVSAVKDLAADSSKGVANFAYFTSARALQETERRQYMTLIPKVQSAIKELAGKAKFENVVKYEQSKAEILADLESAARNVGEQGTLFWYISSHGMAGKLRSFDAKTIESKELIEAVTKGRTFDGKLIPIRRAYFIFDYCNAGISVDNTVEALSSVPFAASGKADGTSLKSELFTEGLIYSVTSTYQVSYRYNFLNGLIETLKLMREDPTMTIRTFLGHLSREIGEYSQKNFADAYPTPQAPHYVTVPNDDLLDESFFEPSYGEACPPYRGKDWVFNKGRDSKGACFNPAAYCLCEQQVSGTCAIYLPGTPAIERMLAPAEGQNSLDKQHYGGCINTCDQMIKSAKDKFLAQCGGKVIGPNSISRLLMRHYTPQSFPSFP